MLNNESLIQNITLDGFQVVQGQLFKNERSPVMTIYTNEVAFAREAHAALNNCAAIQLLVNVGNRTIIVRPSASTDEHAIVWERQLKDTYVPRFHCPCLTRQLYALWNWNTNYRYKTDGRLVRCEKKVMILFDFNEAKPFDGLAAVNENG
ncbi:MAG TPA: hypothetical protein DIW48_04630 [Sphaerochaeta sp.]|nr:hypothetical protein [Sphaerochaeta sp.]